MFYMEEEIKHMDINLKLLNKLKIQSNLYGNIQQKWKVYYEYF